jgi:membrane protease YdiL (CAAX protease family)
MTYYPTIRQTFGLFGFLILMTLLFSFSLKLIDNLLFDINDSLMNFLSYSLPTIITSHRYLKKRRKLNADNYTIKISNTSWLIYVQIIILTIMMIIIIDPITVLIPVPDWFDELMSKMVSKDIYSFMTIVLFAPFFEELIFRGIILDGFLKVYSPRKSIICSSLLFALIHLNPWQAIDAFLIGLFIGWVYYKTQSIIPCILIHFTNNVIAFLIFMFSASDASSISDLIANKVIFISLIASLSVLFYFGIRFLNRQLNKSYTQHTI